MSTFNPLDEKGAVMKKGIFLTSLRTGAYIPVKSEKKGKVQYQLRNIEGSADEKIKKSIVSKATIAHQYFKMEGKRLPTYNFVDLKGKSHNKKDTKGKIVVLKCWFITCKVCVEEFPQLNALVDKYKGDNVEFISLAFDEKDELVKFLKTKSFKYVTVPNQKKYMSKKLKVKQYPTHLIVDSRGVIIKMVNNVKTLTSELKNILGK
jgi:thiol-disulfide isomerase/thioredoxin